MGIGAARDLDVPDHPDDLRTVRRILSAKNDLVTGMLIVLAAGTALVTRERL
jgi:hypothetical protein